MTTHPPKLVQRLKATDSLPYIAPITTTLAPAPKPIMDVDDELARYKAMNDDLLLINKDLTKIIAERDCLKAALNWIRRTTTDKRAADLASEALNH